MRASSAGGTPDDERERQHQRASGDGTEFSARVAPESEVAEDETVPLVASLDKLHLFDEDTGTTITY